LRRLTLRSLFLVAAPPAPSATDLPRPAFWQGFPDAGASDGIVTSARVPTV
jgi:hypothetical protein